MILLFLLQLEKLRPENIFGGQVLERTPAGLTIVYLIGMLVLIWFLIMSFYGNFRRPKFNFEQNLPREVVKKLTSTLTNRSLRIWQIVFVLLAFTVYGFHVYWTYYATDANEQFQFVLNYKDMRSRRTSASNLRGWMLDRSGKLQNSLAYYKVDKDGTIDRTFPLEREMAHLLGTELGTPGLERTIYQKIEDPMPESWEILTKYKKPEPENRDVRITIDRELQAYAAKRLEGKIGGIVVINPQTGDVLAMYSNPTYSLNEAGSLEGHLKLKANLRDQPLLNRATRQFYIPGSTFKTFTMISAFRAGRQDIILQGKGSPECYTPSRGARPICDAGGGCHACGDVGMKEAFKVSSNQFFSQLANELGRERMGETANSLGITATETPKEALTQGFYPGIWNTSNPRIANAISPARSTIVNGKDLSLHDFALEGMGQGLAGQMTPLQMALIASAPANMEGKLMKPKIEYDIPPQMYSQVLTAEQAAVIRDIMSTVTEESGGTGGIVRAKLLGTGIQTGGKTGTADKEGVVVYNKDGTKKMKKVKQKNENGEWVEVEVPETYKRWDGWFLAIAPLENPQLAIAVVIEDIGGSGYGGTTAAPIAADMILKARELGLLGDKYKPQTQEKPAKKKGK